MNAENKKTVINILATVIVSIATCIVSFVLYANRDENKINDQKLDQKLDKTEYYTDKAECTKRFEENEKLIQEQNKLFLEIKENIGELNGKMDLVIKKK